MTQGDGATVDVDRVHVGVEFLFPGKYDAGERFVDFGEIHVVDGQASAGQNLVRGRNGSGQHHARVVAGETEVDEASTRGEAQLLGLGFAHDQHRRGSVGDLRRVAGGDATTLLLAAERRLQLGQRLECGVAQAFVGGHQRAVGTQQGQDLAVEPTLVGGAASEVLRACPEGVEVVAGEAPLVGDHLGGDALRHQAALGCVAGANFGAEGKAELAVGHCRTHWNSCHHFDAGRHHDVVGAGDDALCGEVSRLLAATALTVDGCAGHMLWPASGEHCVARNVDRLLANLHDAAHDHVVNEAGVDAGAFLQRPEGFARQVDRVPVLQLAVAATQRGANGVDDDGGGFGTRHCGSSRLRLAESLPARPPPHSIGAEW